MLWQPALPDKYARMTDANLVDAIAAQRKNLANQLVILGHHYQQDRVIQFADFTGDSFKLSQLAAQQIQKTHAKYVVFLGVHFMAESADILTPQATTVILPDLSAGCSMADMADYDQTLDCWETLNKTFHGMNVRVIPICYMNCSAAIKSFCGQHGGAVCTSSNAHTVLKWALAGGTQPRSINETLKILFLPDQHLGRNTAAAMGYDTHADICLWNPRQTDNPDVDELKRSTFILWKGHCSVHKLFRPEHVDQIRELWPDVTVIVHPECEHAVVQKSDLTGSTERIMQTIRTAKPHTRWAIGTEVHMVNRLAREAAKRDVTVRMLSDCQCLCTTMYRIDMPHLLWVLDNLADHKIVNPITVNPQTKKHATTALNRMLELVGTPNVPSPPASA